MDKIEPGKVYFVSKERSSLLFNGYTDQEFSRLNEKFKIESCDNVVRSYVKEIFMDGSNRILTPLFSDDRFSYNNKDCVLISMSENKKLESDEDTDRLIEELQNNILNAPFMRVPIYERPISGCKIFILKFPLLNDSQFNYIYELLSVIKNKVLEISNDESERSDIYVDNLKIDKLNTDRVITLKYFIRYHNITEIGIEKYTNDEETEEDGKKETGEDGKKETEDIYLTFGVYGDCNIDFNKIGINELVEKDEDDQNEYAEATSVDSETIEFNLELTKVQ